MKSTTLFVFAALACALPGQEPPPLTAEQQAAFAVLDRLDPLDTTPLRFVRVTSPPVPPQKTPRVDHGFVLAEDGRQVRMHRLDLDDVTVQRPEPGAHGVQIESADLRLFAKELTALLQHLQDHPLRSPHFSQARDQMSLPAIGLVLARACARRGQLAEVHALWRAMPSAEEAMVDLADQRRVRLLRDFGDERLTRADLLQRHRAWLAAFPKRGEARPVAAMVEVQERLLAEERARTGREAEPGTAEDIASLVFRLRDQRTPVHTPVPGPEYLLERTEPDASPGGQLQARGMRAVAALIEALTSDTPSRCVVRDYDTFALRTVGELSEDLLLRITGLSFPGKEAQARWQQWWAAVQERGEDAVLVEITRRGDGTSAGAAARLLQNWPARSGEVIAGLRNSRTLAVRARLLGVLCKQEGAGVLALLQDEMQNGIYLETQVMAAGALLDRGRREGLELMLKAWNTDEDKDRKTLEPAVHDLLMGRDAARMAMAGFLLTSGEPAAVAALGRGLAARSPALRSVILAALLQCSTADLNARAGTEQRVEIEREVARLLLLFLDDRSPDSVRDVSSMGEGRWGNDPSRVKDHAACAAVRLWPNQFKFDTSGDVPARDLQVAEIQNALRARAR